MNREIDKNKEFKGDFLYYIGFSEKNVKTPLLKGCFCVCIQVPLLRFCIEKHRLR